MKHVGLKYTKGVAPILGRAPLNPRLYERLSPAGMSLEDAMAATRRQHGDDIVLRGKEHGP